MAQASSNTCAFCSQIRAIHYYARTTTGFCVIDSEIGIRSFRECIVNCSNKEIGLSIVCTACRSGLFRMIVMKPSINLRCNLIAKSNLKHLSLVCLICQPHSRRRNIGHIKYTGRETAIGTRSPICINQSRICKSTSCSSREVILTLVIAITQVQIQWSRAV